MRWDLIETNKCKMKINKKRKFFKNYLQRNIPSELMIDTKSAVLKVGKY